MRLKSGISEVFIKDLIPRFSDQDDKRLSACVNKYQRPQDRSECKFINSQEDKLKDNTV